MSDVEDVGLDIKGALGIVANWWWIVLILPLLFGAYAYFTTEESQPVYRASARILVQQTNPYSASQWDGIYTSMQVARTYQELVTEPHILRDVANELGLNYE